MQGRNNIRVGTSGWKYDHWKGPFYSAEIADENMLGFYAARFSAVEVKDCFDDPPGDETLAKWRDSVPADFIFAVKGRELSARPPESKGRGGTLPELLERFAALGEKLGPVLFQFSSPWKADPDWLGGFMDGLPSGFRYAFEFRDPSWEIPPVFGLLEERGAAFCIWDLAGRRSPKKITADFVYIRLHGPDANQGKYSSQALTGWAGAFSSWTRKGKEIFCFFDNDREGFAAQNAFKLEKMIS